MGGYNTFCEILSFDKRAVLVPRRVPRCEQTIRAQAAERLKLARWVPEPEAGAAGGVAPIVEAISALDSQPRPSLHAPAGLLDGLDNVVSHCRSVLGLSPVAP